MSYLCRTRNFRSSNVITKHSKLLSVIDAIETGCSPFEVKKMAKYDNFKLLSDSSDDESDVFLPNISNTSITGELEA